MKILWSPEAIGDLASLQAYIAEDDPAAARRVALHIIHNIEYLLPNNPQMGRPGRVLGTRELVIPRLRSLFPIDRREISSKYCAFITERAAGLRAFSGTSGGQYRLIPKSCCKKSAFVQQTPSLSPQRRRPRSGDRGLGLAGVEFIDENGGGSGVRLRERQRPKQTK